ncbi:prolipoprotein diacylglyceryl transferase [Streptomyces sp. NPDC001728]|uniref:prolipoprotein diacylglyceryl transferase n=1 Tax=Streptomyces sp. NPDC001728 TaxID=3154396 RepID=UPI0033177F68
MDLAYLPSPSTGVLHLGPVPLRAYAFCIILGVFVAVWLGNRRWVARGGDRGVIADITIWAVPFGLVGGRLYHVLTSPDAYFGKHGEPIRALYVWEGGLGIWGAIALGGLGAWIGCRRRRIPLPAFADAVAPGIAVAQAIGRWGNWFNQELYGRPTTLPWGLEIDRAHRPFGMLDIATYHPTFLYESLWDIGVAALVLWAARRFALGHGRAFALYAAAYTAGRFWTEYLRIDEAHTFLGLRLNDWTSVVVFLGAFAYLIASARRLPGIEDVSRPRSEDGTERADKPRITTLTSSVDASTGTPARANAD